jgi:type I restriction enzyme S subunit
VKNGWPIKRLGDLSDLVTKGTTPTSIGHRFVQDGINFVKVESISTTGQFIPDKLARITPECHAALERSQLDAGDILFSIAGALGRTAFVSADILPANTNQALAIIRLRQDANVWPKFVLKALETGIVLDQIEKFKGGVAQQNLSLAQVREFQIPLPALSEQQRIVGILDEAFDGIATAKANAEKNLQNARALFESHLQSVFSQRGEGAVEKKLSEVCAITSTLVDPRKKEFLDLLHVGAGNIVSEKGVLIDLKSAREEGLISGKFLFDESMVLYSKIRPYLMKAARPDFNGLCSADMYPLAPMPNHITRDYLFHLLLSKRFTNYAIQGSARAGMPKVNREHLFEFRLRLPPVKRQHELAAQLDALSAETQRLESIYQQKLAALEALKKSLLHQAFSGQL